ncbi:reverse transcriptase, partial [Phytophthora megakarya]
MEWQNLALEATTDIRSEEMEVKDPLAPAATLIQRRKGEVSQDQDIPDCPPSDESPSDKSPPNNSPSEMRPLDLASVASEESDLSSIADGDSISQAVTVKEALEDLDQVTPDIWVINPLVGKTTDMGRMREEDDRDETEDVNLDQLQLRGQNQGTSPAPHLCLKKTDMDPSTGVEDQPGTSDLDLTWDSDQDYDECVYYHEGSDLYAEDVDGQMAVLPEVPVTTEDVKIEDIQLCGSDNQTPEEIDRLRQRILKFRHLLIGKGNALPPAARGVVCDIDVGGARPIALKCCKLQIQFREKLADLIKGLLSAKMINYSR